MTEIPQHLLERTQRRREQLELAAETSPPVTRLESRLNGVVDMASEACSLLAEHVATLVSQEVEKAEKAIEDEKAQAVTAKQNPVNIELARSDDLSVETISKLANRKPKNADGEVVVNLR